MTRFYLHAASNSQSGTFPSSTRAVWDAKFSNVPTLPSLQTLDTTIGASQTSSTLASIADSVVHNYLSHMGVSQPLAAQTVPANLAYTANSAVAESNLNANHGATYLITAYIWRPSTGTRIGDLVNVASGELSITGAEPTSTGSEQVSAGSATATNSSVTTQAGDVLIVEFGFNTQQAMSTSYTDTFYYDGTTVTTTNNTVVSNHASFIDFTGYTFTFSGSQVINAAAGSYAVTGSATTLSVAHPFTADPGSYALTGSAATLTLGHTLAANAGSYALAGSTITDPVTLSMNAAAGSYAVTGAATTLPVAHVINAANGAYSVTGFDTTLPVAHVINAAASSYAVTGSAATQTIARILNLASGAYTLTGADAALTLNASGVSYNLAADAGSYPLTGLDATLTGPTPIPVTVTPSGGIHHKQGYQRSVQLKSGRQLVANNETEFRNIIQSLIAEKTAQEQPKKKAKISRKIRQRVKPQRKLQEFTDYESLFRELDALQNSLISEQLLLDMIAASANAQALLAEEDREIDFILSVI